MTDNKKLIEFLSDTVDYLGLYSPDKNGMIRTGFTLNQKAMLTEIKQRLEQQAQPDEELVEKIIRALIGNPESNPEETKIVRKLLQQKQVNEGLVEDVAGRISDCFELKSEKIAGNYLYHLETDEVKLRKEIRKLLQWKK